MSHDPKPSECLTALFHEQPCWMIGPLAAELRYSIPSVRRFLSLVGYFSSFSHNGAWYTLRSIPRFNQDGLWFYNDIGFSRTGSLTDTLVDLTTRSVAGMTAEKLGVKLRCRCHSVLVQLCRQDRLKRDKIGHSHVYFASDPAIATIQRQTVESSPVVQLPAEIAVLILVEFIRKPDAGFGQLAQSIFRKTNIAIKTVQIERLFEQYDLKKKIQIAAPKH